MNKRPRKQLVLPFVAWDLVWKAIAIRRAVKRKEYKWVVGLSLSNTGGRVPLWYLWRTRGT